MKRSRITSRMRTMARAMSRSLEKRSQLSRSLGEEVEVCLTIYFIKPILKDISKSQVK
jgi:hypothetical protein